ncbi:cadmium resistance transporter [Sphaerisporangium sp. TRM90804]|uniref:cadmium resistance transporter n=1 Tax=Sphaerisporangium sp. TRM90804 TaxID=3031113 RepID=UPI0024492668|nr:cadmium resistance transporter [Sphaerisporangium sp. TRM90804]MDH2425953.1 cadmium resistance transporter [Sphaerisporangium sp. TRM90804]
MNLGIVGQAAGLFAVTNIDDIVILALFFARGAGRRGAAAAIVLGQYLGFAAILALAAAAAFGATFLPEPALAYLGLLPLLLGVKAAWQAWRDRGSPDGEHGPDEPAAGGAPGAFQVAAVTFANGGDNIGVYVPVFATATAGGMSVYAAVFLAMVALWCAAGRFIATRPAIGGALSRWGHVLLPVVLIGLGLLILTEGGAFGL